MAIKTISIEKLKVGMYICELDISWIQSPFLRNKFVIKTQKEIGLLKEAGVKKLKIDNEEGIDVDQTNQKPNQEQLSENSNDAPNVKSKEECQDNSKPVSNIPKVQPSILSKELEYVQVLKEKANETFKSLNKAIANNQPFDSSEIVPVIDETISSLMRNNQALLTMMHLKRYDKELFTHSFSVMTLALSLGISLDYSEEDLHNIGSASLLHDLGWARLPLHLLGKTKAYTENEYNVVKKHIPIVVQQLLKNPDINSEVIVMISQHHERFDGSGYPAAKKKDEIHRGAQLIGLIDHYDEVVHGLLDSPGMIPSLALKTLFIETQNGKFDLLMVQKLIALLGIYPVTSAVLLNSGEKAVVTAINEGHPLNPIVKIFYSRNGRAMVNPEIVNLLEDKEQRKIKNPLDLGDKKNDPLNLLAMTNYKSMV